MSGFKVGDIVVGVPEEFDLCPFKEDHEHVGFMPDNSGIGRVMPIAGVYVDPDIGCTVIVFDGDSNEWCAGTWRHVKKAEDAFIAQMRALKPVKQQA